MHSVFCIVPRVEVACKGLFFIQQHTKEQNQALVSDHSASFQSLQLQFLFHFPELVNFAVVALNWNLDPDVWLTSNGRGGMGLLQ